MKRVSAFLAVILLAGAILLADKYYPYGPSSDEEDVYYAQNFQYVNPHLSFDGAYIPGYYRPSAGTAALRNPTPDYFPVGEYRVPYSGSYDGARYFSQTLPTPAAPGGMYAPYFYPPSP